MWLGVADCQQHGSASHVLTSRLRVGLILLTGRLVIAIFIAQAVGQFVNLLQAHGQKRQEMSSILITYLPLLFLLLLEVVFVFCNCCRASSLGCAHRIDRCHETACHGRCSLAYPTEG